MYQSDLVEGFFRVLFDYIDSCLSPFHHINSLKQAYRENVEQGKGHTLRFDSCRVYYISALTVTGDVILLV